MTLGSVIILSHSTPVGLVWREFGGLKPDQWVLGNGQVSIWDHFWMIMCHFKKGPISTRIFQIFPMVGGRLSPRPRRSGYDGTIRTSREPRQVVIRFMTKERLNKREHHHRNWHSRFLSCPREPHFSFGKASFVMVYKCYRVYGDKSWDIQNT